MLVPIAQTSKDLPRMRVRELLPDLPLGRYSPGSLNSITDVPGVKVHTQEVLKPAGTNTGVTCITPRDEWLTSACYAGIFRFNGCGEMTGTHWLDETGLLHSPIVITNTFSVGAAYQGIYQHAVRNSERGGVNNFLFPLACETYDGFLSDIASFAVRPEHIVHGLDNVTGERVREGNVGGGTGMMCHQFKGGTGSSSRTLDGFDTEGNARKYTLGALVQANYGVKRDLRIGGAPVGGILAAEDAELAKRDPEKKRELDLIHDAKIRKEGSIIIILATDAPLLPVQLQRLAKRATVGLSRVGNYGGNTSGDIFLAFSTGNSLPSQGLSNEQPVPDPYKPLPLGVTTVRDETMDGLFEAAGDAVEEAIYNALCMAEDMIGYKDRKVSALPLGRVRELMQKYL